MRNPYSILGVTPYDSLDIIKAKYRKLCKVYHPDVKDTGSAEKFREIREAWEYLESHTSSTNDRYYWTHKSLFTVERKKL